MNLPVYHTDAYEKYNISSTDNQDSTLGGEVKASPTSLEKRSLLYFCLTVILASIVVQATGYLIASFIRPSPVESELLNRIRSIECSNEQLSAKIKSLQDQLDLLRTQNMGSSIDLTLLYETTARSVVLIENRVMVRGNLLTRSIGSGFVYSADGYVVTNNHVIEGANELLVIFLDGNASKATVVGTDYYSDLAILKLSREIPRLAPLPLGNSSKLKVGEIVIAMGSPFGLTSTMTAGIVSQIGRELDTGLGYKILDVIQHDVPINPGNSGGPLLNLRGEVVGINTAIASSTGTYSGVGFAIPSDTIAREASILIATGTYKHPYLGISGFEVDFDIAQAAGLNFTGGFLVTEVVSGGPADKAGIRGGITQKMVLGQIVRIGGDVIVAVDGRRVLQLDDLFVYLERAKRPGDVVDLTILRGGELLIKTVILGERPPP
ncbi:MAG: trypsin-like peptidase domain-containing protein [Candidatus Bathyarchaeia archaeon]